MENNLKTKGAFFGLYWSQSVQNYKLSRYAPWRKNVEVKEFTFGYLELKSLSEITHKDLKKCQFTYSEGVKMVFSGVFWEAYDKNDFFLGEGYLLPGNVDYLRSQGYAVEWMGLSVEKQIEFGWVKLKESKTES